MSYYLRVEAVNLSYFIMDTNDISTRRGGSLLLLNAMNEVERILVEHLPARTGDNENERALQTKELNKLKNSKRSKTVEKKIRDLEKAIAEASNKLSTPTITKGASWGLFNVDAGYENALAAKSKVIDFFQTDPAYRHATIVVDLYTNHGDHHYRNDRDCVQTLNRWQQMQAPSLAICTQGVTSCAIDKVRPANTPRKLKDKEYAPVSDSVNRRRKHGIVKKHTFYKNITNIDAKYTQDLQELSESQDKGILNKKIAFIYIDGNDFGKKQRECKNPAAQQQFDQNTRNGREKLLAAILKQIHDQPDWLTKTGKIRIETLLWGGDELIWVVPAWQGWWMVNEFYKQANDHIKHNGNPLYHAAGLVFCHHNAPIHRIEALARNLADPFAKVDRKKNLIAYQVLESFDHAGTDLGHYRHRNIDKLGPLSDLLIDAEKMGDIQNGIAALKHDKDFAKRKAYQILHAYQQADNEKAAHYFAKLTETQQKTLSDLQQCFGGEQAHWLHLIDLWDYLD